MRINALPALLLLCIAALPAWAMSLDEAKSRGLVGEQTSGYLGIVSPPGDREVRDLVENVNLRRQDEYERIAARNGIDVEQVEKLAGKRAIERSSPGHFVRLPNGSWKKL